MPQASPRMRLLPSTSHTERERVNGESCRGGLHDVTDMVLYLERDRISANRYCHALLMVMFYTYATLDNTTQI